MAMLNVCPEKSSVIHSIYSVQQVFFNTLYKTLNTLNASYSYIYPCMSCLSTSYWYLPVPPMQCLYYFLVS